MGLVGPQFMIGVKFRLEISKIGFWARLVTGIDRRGGGNVASAVSAEQQQRRAGGEVRGVLLELVLWCEWAGRVGGFWL